MIILLRLMTTMISKTKKTKTQKIPKKFDSYLFIYFQLMYDQTVICLPRQEISEILEESKQNLLLADYTRIFGIISVIIFLLFIFNLYYLKNELVKSEKLNTELVFLFNKIQEDKIADSGKRKYSDADSDSDESI